MEKETKYNNSEKLSQEDFKALIVAPAAFNGALEPNDLLKMFSIPASSNTARTEPPAITPVPSEAGFKTTSPAPERPTIG